MPANEDGSLVIIHGWVTSSDEESNFYKNLVIQDETAAITMSINSYNLYLRYRRGQEIVLDMTDMYIGKYRGLQQLGMPEEYFQGNTDQASFMSPEFFQIHAHLKGYPDLSKIDTLAVDNFDEFNTNPSTREATRSPSVQAVIPHSGTMSCQRVWVMSLLWRPIIRIRPIPRVLPGSLCLSTSKVA